MEKCASRSKNSDDADNYPKNVEDRIREIFLYDRTPCEHDCVDRIECPNEHERTGWTKPAHQAKTGDPHQNAYELNRTNISPNEGIHDSMRPGGWKDNKA
jgi:hypothetical protein